MKAGKEIESAPLGLSIDVDPEALQYMLGDLAENITVGALPPIKWRVMEIEDAGCFYWVPEAGLGDVTVTNPGSGWSGEMSPEAFGLVVSEYFFSHTAHHFMGLGLKTEARRMSDLYSRLRHEIYSDDGPHPEHAVIWAALD